VKGEGLHQSKCLRCTLDLRLWRVIKYHSSGVAEIQVTARRLLLFIAARFSESHG
jgi:hypothetical protein